MSVDVCFGEKVPAVVNMGHRQTVHERVRSLQGPRKHPFSRKGAVDERLFVWLFLMHNHAHSNCVQEAAMRAVVPCNTVCQDLPVGEFLHTGEYWF